MDNKPGGDSAAAFVNLALEAREREQHSINELHALSDEVDAENLFVCLTVILSMIPIDTARESIHGAIPAKIELLAYHLLPRFGRSTNRSVTPIQIERGLHAIHSLFNARMQVSAFQTKSNEATEEIEAVVRILSIDASVIRGSAYPEQTLQEISGIQGHFEGWFKEKTGIGPCRAGQLLIAILRTEEAQANEWCAILHGSCQVMKERWKQIWKRRRKELTREDRAFLSQFRSAKEAGLWGYAQKLTESPPDGVPVSRENVRIDPVPTQAEWDAMVQLIGCTVTDRTQMTDPIEMSRRPLFVISGSRVLLRDISNAFDQLWSAFESVARQDQHFYDTQYLRQKSRWLEERAANCLVRLFPTESIYRNVSYPDPGRGTGSTAELDVAVHWPPFLILVEAKAAQFRLESQLGDIGRLRTDIKKNVEDAFEQARRANYYIRSVPEAQFTEQGTGRTLVIRQEAIQRTYLLTVSLHLLGTLATRLAAVRSLGLFQDEEYPWALSIADLDTVTEFCPGPDVFLHYAERRMEVQQEALKFRADELEFWGAYLKTRLQPERIGMKGDREPDFVWLAGFQEPFDFMMEYRRGDRTEAPVIDLEVPEEIRIILNELRRREDDPGARWIAFSLLSLSDRDLGAVAKMFQETKTQRPSPGMLRRATYHGKDVVMSFVATADLTLDQLYAATKQRTLIEKYRRKAARSIGLGIHLMEPARPFHFAIWVEGSWQHDPDFERLIQEETVSIPVPGSKLPGPNQPCLCGSGLKFKKCCKARIESRR
jgi:hypothetical protein